MTRTTPKIFLDATLFAGGGYRLMPETPGDFSVAGSTLTTGAWAAGADFNHDGVTDVVVGSAGSDDKATDAGRVYVNLSNQGGYLGDTLSEVIIDGVNAGDQAGAAIGVIGSLNADTTPDILIGAPGLDFNGAEAGGAYVLWGSAVAAGVDLGDLAGSGGPGYSIKGQAAGDRAGTALTSVHSLNGDALDDILIGAAGNDAGGADAGAAYVVWGKASTAPVSLAKVATGTGGFRIVGENAGDGAGKALGTLSDVNADGKSELLIGAAGNDAGGTDAGAVYVVYGKATGTEVNLDNVALGTGGFKVTGAAGDGLGAAVASAGDLNADGLADILAGTTAGDRAFVIFGKAGGGTVTAADLESGIGGFVVQAEAGQSLAGMTVAGGVDLNQDGVADYVIGAPNDSEGGAGAGAVYVIWGGALGAVDLGQVAQGIGGTKIVGSAGSHTGSSVQIIADANGDGTPDLLIGSSGAGGEAVSVLYAPTDWQPGPEVYGTEGADAIAPGYGHPHVVGDAADDIQAYGGNDTIAAAGGDDTVDGGAGNDQIDGGAGDDILIGGAGNDTILGGAGNDLIDATQGQDQVHGGDGNDQIALGDAGGAAFGDAGDDSLTGGAGDDQIDAGEGNNSVDAGDGNNSVTAGAGADSISTGAGADTVDAGDGNNHIQTGAGDDHVLAGIGNDTLDGGIGADTLVGGEGDDTYYVDNIGDVVTDSGGHDTVVISADLLDAGWTTDALIETVAVQGTHSIHLTGDSGNNSLVAGGGNDTIDGGDGDDTEIGGEGNDHLHSHAGHDTLVGGTGDDTYHVSGGGAHIEDFQGNDTLDASDSTTDDTIDLEQGHSSEIEHEHVDQGDGGQTSQALDVQFLQDLTGSFGDDIASVRALVPQIVTALQTVQADSAFGVSSFVDKATSPFGASGEWVYHQEQGLSASAATLSNTYNGLTIRYGMDEPEAQIESLMQLALHQGDVGFRNGSARFVILFTDAPFHQAGDGAAGGITTPNNGDPIMDGGGIGEDYPMIGQVRAALESANIIPIFAIANGYEGVYQGLVNGLGRGSVVTLSADSSNVVAAISAGLSAATTTVIENAKGGSGDDHITGNQVDNQLDGGAGNDQIAGLAGNDTLTGAAGSDRLDGGDGSDTAVYAGPQSQYQVVSNAATGMTAVIDTSTGQADALINIETLSFAGVSVALADALTGAATDTVAISSHDLGTATEDSTPLVADALQFASSSVPGAALVAVVDPLSLPPGVSYDEATHSFTLDPSFQDFQSLGLGQSTTVTVDYSVSDGFSTVATSASFVVNGVNDAAVIGGAQTGEVSEDGTLTASGDLSISDVDLGQSLFASGTINSSHGALSIDAAGHWVFSLDNASVQALATGESLVDTLSVAALDGTVADIAITIHGLDEGQLIVGTARKDVLTGTAGNDTLDGGAGIDKLSGLAGNDSYIVDNAKDQVIEALNQGHDTILSSVSLTLAANVEDLTLTGLAKLNGTGNALDNLLTGNAGNNILQGDAGNDHLVGNAGADRLGGGLGDDLLWGGTGNDQLTGGAGSDTFVFTQGSGKDTVTDFTLGVDHLNLHDYGLTSLSQLHFRDLGANTLITMANGDSIVLTGIADFHQLTAGDFVL